MKKNSMGSVIIAIIVIAVVVAIRLSSVNRYNLECKKGADTINYRLKIVDDERTLLSVTGATASTDEVKMPDAITGETPEEYLQRFVDANAHYVLGMSCQVK